MKLAKGKSKAVILAILTFLAIIWAFPLVFTAFTSFKGQAEYNMGNFWDIPKGNELLNNLQYMSKNGSIFDGMFSSLIYASCGAFCAVFIALLAAYALAYLDIKVKMFGSCSSTAAPSSPSRCI